LSKFTIDQGIQSSEQIYLKSLQNELSLRKVLISSDCSIRLRRPVVRKPHSENIRSTYAWEAGADSKFWANSFSLSLL